MAKPEKLNLFDSFFNRYHKEIIGREKNTWIKTYGGIKIPNSEHSRSYVDYKVIDRLTGSETIKRR